jgi:hybrid polyketide synthase/nonribosomal peptide synthetase ACE1
LPDIPNYPWDHSRKFWQLTRVSGFHVNLKDPVNPLLGRRCVDRETSDKIQWRNLLRPKEIRWLKGHQLQNQIVFPASGYISMAVEAVAAAVTGDSPLSLIQIQDFVIDRGIPFVDENFVIESLFVLDIVNRIPGDGGGGGGRIHCNFSLYCGNPYDGSRPMTLHAGGKNLGDSGPAPARHAAAVRVLQSRRGIRHATCGRGTVLRPVQVGAVSIHLAFQLH